MIIFTEGWEKYGPAGLVYANGTPSAVNAIFNGNWSGFSGTTASIQTVTGLSTGVALQIVGTGGQIPTVKKILPTAYARAKMGFWFRGDVLPASSTLPFLVFQDTNNAVQATLAINASNQLVIQNSAGTVVGTSAVVFTTGTIYYIALDITFSNTGAFAVYINNSLVTSGSSDFQNASLATYQNFFFETTSAWTFTFDNLWLDDGTGALLLTSPAIRGEVMASDSSRGFSAGADILGFWNYGVAAATAPGANTLFMRKVIAPAGGATINSVSFVPSATSASANFKAVVYSDVAGTPTTLLGSGGTATTGTTTSAALTNALTTPVALTAGTAYWIGFLTDTSVTLWASRETSAGVKATSTYTSGPPATAPAVTAGQASYAIWANTTGGSSSTITTGQVSAPSYLGNFSYVTTTTVGTEDLFNVAADSPTLGAIHCVTVGAYAENSIPGGNTFAPGIKSGGTDSDGSVAAQTMTASYQWYNTYFGVDPNTSVNWTSAGLDAAKPRYRVAS